MRRINLRQLSPVKRAAVLGAVGGVAFCVVVAVWVHLVLDVDLQTEPTRVTIPEGLEGQRFDQAVSALVALGLEDVRAPRAGYYLGVPTKVESVIPAPGTEVELDSVVTLIRKTK